VAPVITPAVLLRSHDYGDSSRILRFYARDYGLLSVVAKGVRGRSGKGSTTVSNFATGDLTAYVRAHRDLHTMKDFECTRLREGLGLEMLRFAGASAVAELVLAHADAEEQQTVFEAVERALDALSQVSRADAPGVVLVALWTIVDAFGFTPQLDACARCGAGLGADDVGRLDLAAGGVRCPECSHGAAGPRLGPIARGQLDTLRAGCVPDGLTHTRRHLAVASDFIAYHVVSRPLKSLTFLGRLFPPDDVEVGVG